MIFATIIQNRDDDFKSNPNSPSRKRENHNIHDGNSSNAHNSNNTKVLTVPNLLDRTEHGLSAPARRLFSVLTDDWDDDFEDKNDNIPVVRTTSTGR